MATKRTAKGRSDETDQEEDVMTKETATQKGVAEGWYAWLSDHPISTPEIIEAAIKDATTEWLDRNGPALLPPSYAGTIAKLDQFLDRQETSTAATVARIRALHTPALCRCVEGSTVTCCAECMTCETPCPTLAVLAGPALQPDDIPTSLALKAEETIKNFPFWNYGANEVDPNAEYAEWAPDLARAILTAVLTPPVPTSKDNPTTEER